MQGFAGIDIADPGDDPLVQQRGFYRCFTAREPFRENRPVKFIAKGLWPDVDKLRMGFQQRPFGQQHEPEAARIMIADAQAPFRFEHHMIMTIKRVFGDRAFLNPETARHAEMADQGRLPFHLHENIFRTAVDCLNPPSGQRLDKAIRERKA